MKDTYRKLLDIHTRLRGTPAIRVPYGVAADAYALEVERRLQLENAFVDDIQFTKAKLLRLRAMIEDLT